ncbi:energy coupling factor transporter S component ThiW [Ignavigranum ruoffiae]|uniref:energy coupling factor transporter S component ThiW n=1 Tax=Ignavigranum ruoffiae TaxID=89093 RepID=UPI0023555FEC|nr:energy coupling factor transporter S component ThiW [Ignavigranum ruoffiae]
MNTNQRLTKHLFLAIMIALDVILSPILRIEGMAPMSSVMNILAASLMGGPYTLLMALLCGIIRMVLLGIPPLALTGAVFGAYLAGTLFQRHQHILWTALGEIIGTGLIGSLLSYPVMVWFTGTKSDLFWWVYTPRFVGASLMGSVAAYLIYQQLSKISKFKQIQRLFHLIH